ncbi:hypothetical protein HAX54_044125 [Datura stramonium]|uniref:Uncharacterized protein n=1 Tax=Datura stramonium TaxID=4076 RepID=A0ABS8W274_DATST|nr:hypothetical protein [Datura stramonium]
MLVSRQSKKATSGSNRCFDHDSLLPVRACCHAGKSRGFRVVKGSTAGPSRNKLTKKVGPATMDQFIQQDLFGSDQDEWDWSDLSFGCKTPAADRCPMPPLNSYARE